MTDPRHGRAAWRDPWRVGLCEDDAPEDALEKLSAETPWRHWTRHGGRSAGDRPRRHCVMNAGTPNGDRVETYGIRPR